jgi:hypothetical protein
MTYAVNTGAETMNQTDTPMTDAMETAQKCGCHPDGGFNSHFLGCPLYSIDTMRRLERDRAALIAGGQNLLNGLALSFDHAERRAAIAKFRATLARVRS